MIFLSCFLKEADQRNITRTSEVQNPKNIKKDNFDDWLLNQKKEHSVQVFSGLYNWHAQMSKLYFKDESLNQLDDQINRDSLNEKTQELDFFLKQTKN